MKKNKKEKNEHHPYLMASIPNIILNKEERKEISDTIKKIRKIKMRKECYFNGFQTGE